MSTSIFSQKNSETELNTLLKWMEKKFHVTCSYDVDLTSNVPVAIDTNTKLLDQLLTQINSKTAFRAEHIDGKNILVKPKSPGGNFILCGSIADAGNGDAIPGGIVFEKSGKYAVATSENGSFYKIIKYVPSDSITFSSTGYTSKTITISSLSAAKCLDVKLESNIKELKEVAITAYLTTGINYDPTDNSITIRPKNASLLPGQTDGDLLSSLDALPGISTPDSKAGNLNMRGSSPDQTLMMIDNIPLYHKGHFFGTISPFNSNSVESIKVQRNSMSSSYGGRVGGLIEISTPANIVSKPNITVSSTLLDANIYLHTPVVKDKLSFVISARNLYPFNWESPALSPIADFVFQFTEIKAAMGARRLKTFRPNLNDLNGKFIWSISKKHKLTIGGLVIRNFILAETLVHFPFPAKRSAMNMLNVGLNTQLSSNWSQKFSTRVVITSSSYLQDVKTRLPDSVNYDSRFVNEVKDLRALLEASWKIAEPYTLKFGYDARINATTYEAETNVATASLANSFNRQGLLQTAYVNLLCNPAKKLLVNAGLRMNHFSPTQKIYAEPRISLGYRFTDAFRLKASGGMQQQFLTQITGVSIENLGGIENQLWLLADGNKIPVINSFQYSFGGLLEKKTWVADVEAYYKNTENIGSISVKAPLRPDPYIFGQLNTIGVDVMLKKQFKRIDAWVSYSLSKSVMQFDSVQKDAFVSLYDQTHILDVAGSYKYKGWKFSLAFKYRTGLAKLRNIRTKMIAGAESFSILSSYNQPPMPQPPPPKPGVNAPGTAERFADYYMVDAAIQYTLPKIPKKWKLIVGASAQNLLGNKNVLELVGRPANGTVIIEERYMTLFRPNLNITFSW